jgi:hypothetical protein
LPSWSKRGEPAYALKSFGAAAFAARRLRKLVGDGGLNLTGLLLYEGSIVGKWLGLLKEIAPNTARVAFLATPKVSTYAYFLKSAQQVAPSLGIDLVPCPVDTAEDIKHAIEAFALAPNGGLFFPANVASTANRRSSSRWPPNTVCRRFMPFDISQRMAVLCLTG